MNQLLHLVLAIAPDEVVVPLHAVEIGHVPVWPGIDLLIDLPQRLRALGAFHTHQHVVIGRLTAPVATRQIGFVIGRDALQKPQRLVGVRERIKEPEQIPRGAPQHAANTRGKTARLVEVQDVRVFVGDDRVEPAGIVLEAVDLIGRREQNHDPVGRKVGRVRVRDVVLVGNHDVGWLDRGPAEQRRKSLMHALGDSDHLTRAPFAAIVIVHAKVRALQRLPGKIVVVADRRLDAGRQNQQRNEQQSRPKLA